MTQNLTLDSRRERAWDSIWKQMEKIKNELFSKPFLEANQCKVGDILFNTKTYRFRVEKITAKTITLSELWTDNEWHEQGRIHHDTFAYTYRTITQKQIDRVDCLGKRAKLIKSFGKD